MAPISANIAIEVVPFPTGGGYTDHKIYKPWSFPRSVFWRTKVTGYQRDRKLYEKQEWTSVFYHPNWIQFFADQANASDNRREIYYRCGTIWLFPMCAAET